MRYNVDLSNGSWSLVRGFTCPGVHLSVVSGFSCLVVQLSGVQLSGGSLVRGFTCPYFSSNMTFLAEIEAILTKRILFRFGVATPRVMLFCWNIYMSDAVLLKYVNGRCRSAEIYTWAMLFCWSIVAKFPPRFPCGEISVKLWFNVA